MLISILDYLKVSSINYPMKTAVREEENTITYTLVYYAHSIPGYKEGCYYAINTPKTQSSVRQVPLMDFAKDALEQENRNRSS